MYRILIRPTARKVIEIVILVSSMAGVLFYLTNARNRPDKQTFSVGEPVYNRNNDLKLDLERLHAAYDDVDAMLLFIGYPRSRHTLVSALLDAHPNIMLSNEFNLIGSYKKNPEWSKNQVFDKMAKMSYFSAIRGSRAQTTNGNASNYVHLGYKVPNQWQGTFDRTLKIIGDKVGWFTASHLSTEEGRSTLKQLEEKFHVKAKFIHVIRNPFDNISTMALRLLSLRTGEHTQKENIPEELDSSIRRYFYIAYNCQATKEAFGDRVLDIPGEDFVREPTKYLRKICDFLEISCSEDYLRDCTSVVDRVPSKTRSLLVWTPKQIQEVYSLMQPLEFLKSYTFEN